MTRLALDGSARASAAQGTAPLRQVVGKCECEAVSLASRPKFPCFARRSPKPKPPNPLSRIFAGLSALLQPAAALLAWRFRRLSATFSFNFS